ncbi:hypothetical protein BDY19DRAFT_1047873 [Irpex rosettiformis]|uniref:Uncharacterized protein n=1 Tax=Irpex rosettiformis TaxID=378272 RepID=A0ACB8U5Q2_9APHY|nr:hypothetical protein BDY19DRAFT_1047873 [Irpex rosettiformis]
MSPKYRATRKCSDAENLGLKPKSFRKMNRIGSSSTLRDSSLRRRNRVISGLPMPKSIMSSARRQKATQHKAATDHSSNYALPTPPESPMSMCVSPPPVKETQNRRVTLQFPKRLVRPQTKGVRHQTVAACDPEGLKEVPVHYVREALDTLAPRMLKVCSGIRAPRFMSPNALPKELVVFAQDLSAQMPTHLLAVYNKPENGTQANVILVPAHNVVLTAYCANMPRLPVSSPAPPSEKGGPIQLPVVPMNLPHPQSYGHIQQYLYTKDRVTFLMSMLPSIPPQAVFRGLSSAAVQYAKDLAMTVSTQKILAFLRNAHGIYRNMYALDVQEDVMWGLLNVAWEVLLTALALSAGTPQMAPLPLV